MHIVKLDCEKLEYVCEICSILKEMSLMHRIILFLKLGGGVMKTYCKAGILTVSFTLVFLLLFPGLGDRWTTIFGLACVFLFTPRYTECKEHSSKHKFIVLISLFCINILLILAFCDRNIIFHQFEIYLGSCIIFFLVFFIKKKYTMYKKEK